MTVSPGALGSIMNIFRSTKPDNPAAQTPPATATGTNTAVNGVVPNPATQVKSDGTVAAIPVTAEGDASPLAEYAQLWQTAEGDGKKPTLTPDLKYDPKKLLEGAKKVDFSKAINPEHATKLAQGFDPAAFNSAISEAVQAGLAYAQGSTLSIVQSALAEQERKFNDEVLPAKLREHTASSSIAADNPIFDNPAVAPMLKILKDQLITKYPTASADEINKHAKTLLQGMSGEIIKASGGTISTAAETKAATGAARPSTDWEAYFKG